jgi:RNA polymerase sigma factor (sigma-70 family)
MADTTLNAVLRHVRQIASPTLDERGDRELLHAFATQRDEASFAALLRRYGPLVLAVCRRVLHHEQDAEDAFQATFLVLAAKASSIRKQASLSSFLHGVAHRLCLKAKRDAARRRIHEAHASVRTSQDAGDLAWREVQALLEEEIERLPETYRAPFLLCYLQGFSRAETARQLGIKEGTVWSRLAKARSRLQKRLAGRGVALSAALAALALSQRDGMAMPMRLMDATLRAARMLWAGESLTAAASARVAGLVQTSLQTFAAGKLKLALVGLAFLLLMTGAGGAIFQALTAPPQTPEAKTPPSPKRERVEAAHVDRQGDPLPPGAIARLGTVRFRHGYGIRSVAFSPDGKMMAAGGIGRTISLWDAATGKERRPFLNPFQAASVAFSPDGKVLASAGWNDSLVVLWDASTGEVLRTLRGQSGVFCVAFAPNGKLVASGSLRGTVYLWNPATGEPLRHVGGDWGEIVAVVFSPDSKLVAFAGKDGKIRLWNASTGDELRRLDGHPEGTLALAFSPDGELLASGGMDKSMVPSGKLAPAGSMDQTIRLWSPTTGKQIRIVGDRCDAVTSVAFSPDGRLLASAHRDGSLALWDPHTGRNVRRWQGHAFAAASVAFSPDGKRLASGSFWGSAVRLWDVASGAELQASDAHQSSVDLVRWLPDGKTLVSIDHLCRTLWWDLATQRPRRQVARPTPSWSAFALSADGKMLATGGFPDCHVRLAEIDSDKPGRVLGKHQNQIQVMVLSPDGRLLASGSRDEAIRLWDVEAGKQVRQFEGPGQIAGGLAFAPDGKTLAYETTKLGATAGKIRLVDVTTGKEIRAFDSQGWVTVLVFSPDGKVLASWHNGSPDKPFIRLWDVATGKELCRHNGNPGGNGIIAFSPDGKLVASGEDGWSSHTAKAAADIHLWEAATGRLIRRFEGHHSGVRSLAFSPDGLKLASGSGDSTILIWDITGRPRKEALTPSELDTCWNALADADPAKAYDAVWALVAAPEQALPFLRKHLPPVPHPDAKIIAGLLADLDTSDFKAREKATEALKKLGDAAVPALRRTLMGQTSLEMRRRVQELLDRTREWNAERLREHRAMQALEHIGTRQAREVLEEIAAGAAGARRTEEAKAALRRAPERG